MCLLYSHVIFVKDEFLYVCCVCVHVACVVCGMYVLWYTYAVLCVCSSFYAVVCVWCTHVVLCGTVHTCSVLQTVYLYVWRAHSLWAVRRVCMWGRGGHALLGWLGPWVCLSLLARALMRALTHQLGLRGSWQVICAAQVAGAKQTCTP